MNANAQFHADRLAGAGGGGCGLFHSGELGSWYAGHSSAENVACVGPCSGNAAQQFMGLWLNSPDHRANIFTPDFRFIGVGVACNGRELFAVVHFRS
jgi:uncharacterized protein YkwD